MSLVLNQMDMGYREKELRLQETMVKMMSHGVARKWVLVLSQERIEGHTN